MLLLLEKCAAVVGEGAKRTRLQLRGEVQAAELARPPTDDHDRRPGPVRGRDS